MMTTTWLDALQMHAMMSALICGIGFLLFRSVNRRGNPRSRWQGYWALGGAMLGYQAAAGLMLATSTPGGTFYNDELAGVGLTGLLIGLLFGNIVGACSRHTQPREDPPPDDD